MRPTRIDIQALGFSEELLRIEKEAGLRDLASKAKGMIKKKVQDFGLINDPALAKKLDDFEARTRAVAEREGIDVKTPTGRSMIESLRKGDPDAFMEEQFGPAVIAGGRGHGAASSLDSLYGGKDSVMQAPEFMDPSTFGLLGQNRRAMRAAGLRHEVDEIIEGRKAMAAGHATRAEVDPENPSIFMSKYEPQMPPQNLTQRIVHTGENLVRKLKGEATQETMRGGMHNSPNVILNESDNVSWMPDAVRKRYQRYRDADNIQLGPSGFEYGKPVSEEVRGAVNRDWDNVSEKMRKQFHGAT